MKKYWHFAFGFFLIFAVGEAQETFTKQDTLRGSITKERSWWDVTYYHLDIKVNPADSTISGSNTIRYKVLNSYNRMQVDLQRPLEIYKVTQEGKELNYQRMEMLFLLN